MRVLLIGGSKSGKSHLAQELCRKLSNGKAMYYWATMQPTDSEDRQRIQNHLKDRDGWGFETIECGRDITSVLSGIAPDSTILFDSLTALLANEMFGNEPDLSPLPRVSDAVLTASQYSKHFIAVCDDIWRDGVIYDQWTEQYRSSLAHLCRILTSSFDVVAEISGGIVHLLKGDLPL